MAKKAVKKEKKVAKAEKKSTKKVKDEKVVYDDDSTAADIAEGLCEVDTYAAAKEAAILRVVYVDKVMKAVGIELKDKAKEYESMTIKALAKAMDDEDSFEEAYEVVEFRLGAYDQIAEIWSE